MNKKSLIPAVAKVPMIKKPVKKLAKAKKQNIITTAIQSYKTAFANSQNTPRKQKIRKAIEAGWRP